MGVTIGIDLGTSNSCVAFHDGAQGATIETPQGKRTMPSVVSWRDGDMLIGEAALRNAPRAPDATFREVKRLMGETYSEEEHMGRLVVEGPDGLAALRGPDGVVYTPADVSALIMAELKRIAENRLPDRVTGVVVCHPAYFSNEAKEATRTAALKAGFKDVSLLSEPMAAAIAYGLMREKFARVVVYDLGGGTFDVAIMDVGRQVNSARSADGDMHLGGGDFDRRIVDAAMVEFLEAKGIDLAATPFARDILALQAEEAKVALSGDPKAEMFAPSIHTSADTGEVTHLQHVIEREAFEAMTRDLVSKTLDITERALEKAGRERADIDDIILVGGMTRVPMVRKAVEAFFGRAPLQRINPDEIVALGAAIKGAEIDGRIPNFAHDDIVARPIKVQVETGALVTVIPAGARFPIHAERVVSCRDEDAPTMGVRVYATDRAEAHEDDLVAALDVPRQTPDARWSLRVNVDDDSVITAGVDDPSADLVAAE